MLKKIVLSVSVLAVAIGLQSFAQTGADSLRNAKLKENQAKQVKKHQNDSLRKANTNMKPTIGIGPGMFHFFGDVNHNKSVNPMIPSFGFNLNVAQNISPSFRVDFDFVMGNLVANERSVERNLNFKSRTINGSAQLTYTFAGMLKPDRVINPYISVGIGVLNFDTKGDWKDKNDSPYYYWNDGSIRDIAQTDPAAENAVALDRDYNYETDLRQANLDSLGKYSQVALTVPLSFGFDFKISDRMRLKLGSTFYYSFTDLIDNVSAAGSGIRKGNDAKDMYLFSNFTLHYDFFTPKKKTPEGRYTDIDFTGVVETDSDGDGIAEELDKCPDTPKDEGVDENGCPLDTDVDFIAGKQDKETTSASGALVNSAGISYNDSIIAKEQEDSIAVLRRMISTIYPSGTDSRKVSPLKSGDMELLSQKVELIQQDLQRKDDLDNFFESVSDEVKRKNITDPKEIEKVFKSVNGVYTELTKLNPEMNKTLEVAAQKDEHQSTIPSQFLNSDANEDGLLTADEILRVIEQFLDGGSSYSLAQVYELIDYYDKNMKGVRVIDFGATKGVYIAGKLNILPKTTNTSPELIDYYDKNMKGVRVIDFGATKGVYIAGKLNILPKTTNTSPETLKRRQLAKEFKTVDLNRDGEISPDEINSVIKLYQAGSSLYSNEMMNKLIDIFLE